MVHADELRDQLTDDTLVDSLLTDFDTANIDDTTKAILQFAVKVTESAHSVTAADLDHLRKFGITDETLFAIVEIVGFFCYINRLASAFGVELDDFIEGNYRNESKG